MRRIQLLVLLAVVAASVYLRTYRLFDPWVGVHTGWGGAVYGQIARNYVKFGYRETRLGPVANGGVVSPGKFEFYYHYPPLQVLLTSAGYLVFGNHEWSARVVPLAFSLLSMGLLYGFARRHFG